MAAACTGEEVCPGYLQGDTCHLTEPEQVVCAIEKVVSGSTCWMTYRVADDLFGQVTQFANASAWADKGSYLYDRDTPQDWFTNHTGIEAVLNNYCCNIPESFGRRTGEARSACLCFMAFGVAYPITATAAGNVSYVVAKADMRLYPLEQEGAYEKGVMAAMDLTRENLKASLTASLEYTYLKNSSGVGVSWAGPSKAVQNYTQLPCELQEDVLDQLWLHMQKPYDLCDLMAAHAHDLIDQLKCDPCYPLQADGRGGGGEAGCFNTAVFYDPDVVNPKEICSSARLLRVYLAAMNQYSALFTAFPGADARLSACGQS